MKQSSTTHNRKIRDLKLMKFESLSLEVAAKTAGLLVVKPAVLNGKSGVEHRFDSLVSDGPRFFAFDFYDSVGDMDVLRTYIKKFDTGATTEIVCSSGKVTGDAATLAREYGIEILAPDQISTFFQPRAVATSGRGHQLVIP